MKASEVNPFEAFLFSERSCSTNPGIATVSLCQRSSENVEIWTVPVRWQDYCKVTLQYHPLIIEASSADSQDSGAAAVQKNTFLHDRQQLVKSPDLH
jgi:hypothetical protein